MKKSNKVTVFYVISSFVLFAALVFGGCYGIYLSVGLKFVRSSVSNFTEGMNTGGGENVSYNGSVNYSTSMVGVIILSIILVVLSIFDIISLIKQIVFFKQFKAIRNSKIEQKVEKKVKSRGRVLFFVFVIDILSLAAGIAGIFINSKSFTSGNFVWIMYAVDGLVSVFSLISMILLIIKLKQVKKLKEENTEKHEGDEEGDKEKQKPKMDAHLTKPENIDDLENKLLKLRYLKSSRLISEEEYRELREKYFYESKKPSIEENKENFDEK